MARYRALDPNVFEISHDVPVFCEHTGDDGTVYTREVLEAICANQNARIEDTGDYTAICAGHTPTPDDRTAGAAMPEVVGFSGPYYVGIIGSKKPKAAIIARNWGIFKDRVNVARRLPRRSVEIYQEADPRDRYFDPIAILGADMPRLDLGLAYSRIHEGAKVARYAAAFPSGSDTFVPAPAAKQPAKYSEQESVMLTDEDVQKLVQAVQSLPEFQWAAQQMAARTAEVPADPAAAAVPGEVPPPDAPAAPPAIAPEVPANDPPNPAADPEKEKMAAQYSRTNADKIRYARLEAENKALQTDVVKIKQQLAAVETEKRQVARYSRLEKLAYDRAMVLDEEVERVKGMTDAQFEDHAKVIAERYQKIPVNSRPITTAPPQRIEGEDKSFERRSKAQDLAMRYQRDGKTVSWEECWEEAGKK